MFSRLVLLALLIAPAAHADFFGLSGPQTVETEIRRSQAAVLATIVRVEDSGERITLGKEPEPYFDITYRIDAILKEDWPVQGEEALKSFLSVGDKVVRRDLGEKSTKPGRQFLCLARGMKDGFRPDHVAWQPRTIDSVDFRQYVIGLADRLAGSDAKPLDFYGPFLEHDDSQIAADAFHAIDHLSIDQLATVSESIPLKDLRSWAGSPEIRSDRRGLYVILLGLKGSPGDMEIVNSSYAWPEAGPIGAQGRFVARLLLGGEDELTRWEQQLFTPAHHVLTKDARRARFVEQYGLLQALRFLHKGSPGGVVPIARERMLQSVRMLVEVEDLADLAIGQLRVWRDWDAVEQVWACYQDPKTVNTIKRAVVFYLMDLVASADEADIEARDRAKQHLATLDQTDRDAFRKAERLYFKFFSE